jgi:excisionase family DNA binding protein
MSAGRAELIAAHVAALRREVVPVPAVGAILTAPALTLVSGLVAGIEELLGRDRSLQITPQVEALRTVVEEARRAGTILSAPEAATDLALTHEVDLALGAKLMNVKPDTLRDRLRDGRFPGRKVSGGHWRVPLSAVEAYLREAP